MSYKMGLKSIVSTASYNSLSSESFISLSSSSFLSTFFTTERIFDVVGESSLSFLIWPVAGMEEGVVACEGQRDCKCRQRK
jgi:hypothetical protein